MRTRLHMMPFGALLTAAILVAGCSAVTSPIDDPCDVLHSGYNGGNFSGYNGHNFSPARCAISEMAAPGVPSPKIDDLGR